MARRSGTLLGMDAALTIFGVICLGAAVLLIVGAVIAVLADGFRGNE